MYFCFRELDAQTNKWFYSQFRKSKRNKKTNNVITGPEIVRASIRHAHRDSKPLLNYAIHYTAVIPANIPYSL